MQKTESNPFWDVVEEFTVGEAVVAISRTKDQFPRYSLRVGARRGPWFPIELLTTDHLPSITAAVAKARYDWARTGLRFELDGGWFSGDSNLDDGALTGFKANPNYQQGILMFSQVLGWQSGRARVTASNPQTSGYPSADLDRLATGGQVTSAITAFPKVGWKATSFLEVYGGALLAWSPTQMIDPFTTHAVAGGSPRNYLGNVPDGSNLGTEFDLGAVATLTPAAWPMALTVRGEYAVLLAGGAMAGTSGDSPVQGGRLSLALVPKPSTKERR